MISEHDEGLEPLDGGPKQSAAEKSDSTSPKKSNGPTEHAKHRRRRGRGGKKRKQRTESGNSQPSTSGAPQLRSDGSGSGEIADGQNSGTDPSGSRINSESDLSRSRSRLDIEPSVDTDSPWDSNEELEENEVLTFSGQIIRPNAPHAPKNSTQFIIDDHNECHLYMSFETPNPYLSELANDGTNHVVTEPIGEDAAYIDIDYQYESPQDFDNTAYYDREFELSYKSNRFEELLRLPREELISGLQVLESRLKELSDDLVKENPSPILEKLQHDLLELQEKHCELKEANTKLTQLVMQNEKTAEMWAAEQQTSGDTKTEEDVKNDVCREEEDIEDDVKDETCDQLVCDDSHTEIDTEDMENLCEQQTSGDTKTEEDGSDDVCREDGDVEEDETCDQTVCHDSPEVDTEDMENLCVSNNKPEKIDCDSPQDDSVEISDMYCENNGLDPLPRKVDSEEMRAAATV